MSIITSTLPNGLTVATDEMADVASASVGVWVHAGARHETLAQNGLSHMLEHMAFKGTTKRSALDIANEVEAVGGHLNAYTAREQTCYYARMLKDDVALGADILADIVREPVFAADELERERGVILQEIGQAEDTPDDIVFDMVQEAAYSDQPMGRSILGTAERVSNFTADDCADYRSTHYEPGSMVFAAAGAVAHSDMEQLAHSLFGDMTGQTRPAQAGAQFRPTVQVRGRPLEQMHVALTFDGIGLDDPDYYAAQVLATALGGGMSSRLFQEVREKRGLVYSVYAYANGATDCGQFGIYAGTGPQQTAELMDVLADECAGAGQNLTDDDIDRARAQMRAGVVMALESSAQRAEQMARQLQLLGRIVPIEEQLADLEKVDQAAVAGVAGRIFADRPAAAFVGPDAVIETAQTGLLRFAA